MSLIDTIQFWKTDPYKDLVKGLEKARQDHDTLALLPYDDGTFFLKPADFDKELIGGQGGYETADGDKIVLDGDGQPVRELFGVPMLLGVDPTEHAAAVEPIKALVAQKENIGEWLRVDREANVVQVGPALEQAAETAIFENPDSDDHWKQQALDYEEVREWIDATGTDPDEASDELVAQAVDAVEREAREQAESEGGRLRQYLPWGDTENELDPTDRVVEVDIEESMVGDRLRELGVDPSMASEDMVEQAMKQLADDGDLKKIYDIAPPSAPTVADGGQLELDEATHIAVDQSKAADLIPNTTSTTELNVAIDKARMEEHDEDRVKNLITYGIIIGAVVAGVFAVLFAGMFFLMG